jgi:hypothetical protein
MNAKPAQVAQQSEQLFDQGLFCAESVRLFTREGARMVSEILARE